MRRLYYLIPSVPAAQTIVDDLLLARIPEKRIHVVARRDLSLANLPAAGLAQKTDLIPSIERGLGFGAITGLLVGLTFTSIPGLIVLPSGIFLIALVALGMAVGAWISSMIGVSVESSRVRRYEPDIRDGKLLMMVDLPARRTAEINALMQKRHPEAAAEGIEPHIPAFP